MLGLKLLNDALQLIGHIQRSICAIGVVIELAKAIEIQFRFGFPTFSQHTYRRERSSDLGIDDIILAELLQQTFVIGTVGGLILIETIDGVENILEAIPNQLLVGYQR